MAVSIHDIGPISRVIHTNLCVLSNSNISAKDLINATLQCVRRTWMIPQMARYLHRLRCTAPADDIDTEVGLIECTIQYCIPIVMVWMKECNVDESGYMLLTRVYEYKDSSVGTLITAATEDEVHKDYYRTTYQSVF